MNQPWFYSEVQYLICGICRQKVPIDSLDKHNCRSKEDFTKQEINTLIDRVEFITSGIANTGYRTPKYSVCIALMYALRIYRDTFFKGGENE